MSRSEIFDAYEKIAIETGLVSDNEPLEKTAQEKKDSPAMKRYKKSPNPRAGSDDISTIEALYGVKCDNTVKYDYNIFENAHPNSVIIGPAYDRMNGLIENPNERQNFIINMIVDKCPDGQLTQHRYAKQELLMELIRVANDLDARGEDDLRVIADSCIEHLTSTEKKSPEITKKAIFPLIFAGAAVLAATWLWNHIDDPSHGITNDIHNSISKLDALKTNSWYESDVDATVQQDVNVLEQKLNALNSELNSFGQVVLLLDNPTLPENSIEMNGLAQTASEHGAETNTQMNKFVAAIDKFVPDLIVAINKFTSRDYEESHSTPSWESKMIGWVGEATHGRYGLFANDFVSAANALGALKTSLMSARNKAMNIDQVKQTYVQDLNEKVSEFKQKKPTAPSMPLRQSNPIFNSDSDQIVDDVGMAEDSYINAAKAMGFKPRRSV